MKPTPSLPKNDPRSSGERHFYQAELLDRGIATPLPCRWSLAVVLGCIAIVLSAANVARGQTYTVLHAFNGTDGLQPMGSVILDGSTLYATTSQGGTYGDGTIFSIGTDGGSFQSVLSFSGGTGGDQAHHGTLALSGSTLYGMTVYGGVSDGTSTNGNVYSVSTNGTNYQNLHSFIGGTDGSQPHGDVIVSGSTLYGMTSGLTGSSGTTFNSNGTVFSIATNGTGFQTLVPFTGTTGPNLGAQPHTGLTRSGQILYGMTMVGGTNNKGTVFSVNTDGSGFVNLLSFTGTGGPNVGESPAGDLLLAGSTLYGMTSRGGTSDKGTIFSVNADGSNFKNLLSFTGTAGPNLGAVPWGVLTLSGSTLYGMTSQGGTSDNGTIFSVNTDGTGFQSLLSFSGTGGESPGSLSWGSLLLNGSTLYGTTSTGGAYNDGVVFSLTVAVPEPSTLALVGLGAIGLVAAHRKGKAVKDL